jgi:hypothetical protein
MRRGPGGRSLPPREEVIRLHWIRYRLLGRCWAQGCGRLMALHTPRQLRRCEQTPMAIELTDRGWLYGNGIEPESVYRKTS